MGLRLNEEVEGGGPRHQSEHHSLDVPEFLR